MNYIPKQVVVGADRLFDDLIDRLGEAGATGCRISLIIQPSDLSSLECGPNLWHISTTIPARDETVKALNAQVAHLQQRLAEKEAASTQ